MRRGLLIILYPVLLPLAFVPVLYLYVALTPQYGTTLFRPATLFLLFLLCVGWGLVRDPSDLPVDMRPLLAMFRRHYVVNVAAFLAAAILGHVLARVGMNEGAPDNISTVIAATIVSWLALWTFVPFVRAAFRPPQPSTGEVISIKEADRRGLIRRSQRDKLREKGQ